MPAGYYNNGSFTFFGDGTYYWSATERDSGYAYRRSIGYGLADVRRGAYPKDNGFSVRCVKD